MTRKIACLLLSILFAQSSCGPVPDLRALSDTDLQPPVLLALAVASAKEVELSFHEPAEPLSGSFMLAPTISLVNIVCTDTGIRVLLGEPLVPGVHYHLEGVVKDASGNRLKFITNFYGYNSEVPELCINEFTTRGTGTHPDVVELYVRSEGSLAGVCMFEGTADNWSDRYVFPHTRVQEGDYIVVHFKPQGIADEVDETTDPTLSGGQDATDGAWDFWLLEGSGLSGNNGVVSVYSSPNGSLIDAVLYSNRTSSSDDRYRGFGSKDVLERAEQLHAEGGWLSEGELVAPEDAVNPDGSTGTRSLCRDSDSSDTDSVVDWHIVPTRGASFGAGNTDDRYEP